MLNDFALLNVSIIDTVITLGIVLLLMILVFEVAMFVSVIRNKYIPENTRVLWIIGMLLIHPFIAIVYYFTDHKKIQ